MDLYAFYMGYHNSHDPRVCPSDYVLVPASIPLHLILRIELEWLFFLGLIVLMITVFSNNVPSTGILVRCLLGSIKFDWYLTGML